MAKSDGRRDVLVGRVFNNRFRIQSLIARGGMGKVYRAIQVPLGRIVALKVLNSSYTGDDTTDFHRRFFREAAIAARLTHPNTVTVFDFGKSDDDIYYLAMEFLNGVSLRTALLRERVFAPHRAVHIATQIARAVHEAHQLGAVHRDLKPANVFLLPSGDDPDFVKVLDFGLVKHVGADEPDAEITQPGKFLGSPGYMAPEQIRGETMDGRCDVYAMGVLLYEMLTGRPPFVRTGAIETMMAHVHDPVPSLRQANPTIKVTPRLEEIVRRCLGKRPDQRYATIGLLLNELLDLAGLPIERTHTQVSVPRRTPVRLDEDEASGWAVVSTTGILAMPRGPSTVPRSASPTQGGEAGGWEDEPVTRLNATLAMGAAPLKKACAPPTEKVGAESAVRPPRRHWAWATAVAAAAAIFVGGATWALTQKLTPPSDFTLVLDSTPSGAAVYLGVDLLCPSTPCRVNWQGQEAQWGHPMSLRFVLEGFDEFVASRIVQGECMEVRSTLYPRQASGSL